MKVKLALVLAAVLGLPQSPLQAQSPERAASQCLVLVAGAWTPYSPGAPWSAVWILTLAPARDELLEALGDGQPWRQVHVRRIDPQEQQAAEPDEYYRAWGWVAPTADSLRLLRPAVLSAGIAVIGRWRADTLVGRANVFSDAVGFPQPRANAYAVRFDCGAHDASRQALTAVGRLIAADVPDPLLGAREDSLARAKFQWLPPR